MDHPWLNRAEQALVQDCPTEARVLVSGYMRHYPDDADARLLLARLNRLGTEPPPLLRHRVALPETIWKRSMFIARPAWLSAPNSTDASATLSLARPIVSAVAAPVAPAQRSFSVLWFVVPLFLVFAEALLAMLRAY